MTSPSATVFIPTFNGEDYLERLLVAVEGQEYDGDVEILVIDSGSTDRTLEILAGHPDVRLHRIPNSEFGHGRTRDLAARMATGDRIAYLTQDAVPIGPHWLTELLSPFELDPRIAIVTGRQKPRESAFPLQKYDIMNSFQVQGHQSSIAVFDGALPRLTPAELSVASFHSDVNAAVRRELAVGDLPFRDVPYSEDVMMAADAFAQGYLRAYAGRAVVEHSNDLTFREYGPRIFDETVGLRRLGHRYDPMPIKAVFRATLRGSIGDAIRIGADSELGVPRRMFWLVANPFFQWRRWSALRAATRVDLDDEAKIRRHSLEHARKQDR